MMGASLKNQYFGDVNDYMKFGMLRALHGDGQRKLHIAWMLTPDDGGPDGKKREYLSKPKQWERYDTELFSAMGEFHRTFPVPNVGQIEATQLLRGATYHGVEVPDGKLVREEWRAGLVESVSVSGADAVFFDPDNGIEVRSRPVGRKGSSKYVAWNELELVWSTGCSMVIYQHYPRESRDIFEARLKTKLANRLAGSVVFPLRTPNVLFLLVSQAGHESAYQAAMDSSLSRWAGKICRPSDIAS